jgi:hypothetical protein
VARDIVVKELVVRATQQVDVGGRSAFLELSGRFGLGVAARDRIEISDVA